MPLNENFGSVLTAARAGAQWAWGELYSSLAPVVLGYFKARRAPDPEDLLGEVFLQAVRDIDGFEGGEREFRAWLLTLAHHRLIDSVRYRSRRPVETVPPEALSLSGIQGDVETEAMAGLGEAWVRTLIARLSPDQQTVLLLRLLGEMTIEEIAGATGKRPGAVKALQRRGLAALKREISKEGVPL